MDGAKLTVTHDQAGDVLYIREIKEAIYKSSTRVYDGLIVLNFGGDDKIVGLQLLEVSTLSQRHWREFSQAVEIPKEIFDAVDEWLGNKLRAIYPCWDGER